MLYISRTSSGGVKRNRVGGNVATKLTLHSVLFALGFKLKLLFESFGAELMLLSHITKSVLEKLTN